MRAENFRTMKNLLIGDVYISGRCRKSCCLYTDEDINTTETVYYEPVLDEEIAFNTVLKSLTLETQKRFLLEHPGGTFYRININKYTERELRKIERLIKFKPKLQTIIPNIISFLKEK